MIRFLNKDTHELQEPIWYRGHAKSEWKLEPHFDRLPGNKSEIALINQFKQKANLILDKNPKNEFDWLFLMQHHGIPTRLLDWTENPLVALYFVVNDYVEIDGTLWVLLPLKLNIESKVTKDPNYVPSFDDDDLLNYSPKTLMGEEDSSLKPAAAIAVRNNSRMAAQLSVFTISHRRSPVIERIGNRKHIWKYIVPADCKEKIKNELKEVAINEFTLYPELDKIRSTIKW